MNVLSLFDGISCGQIALKRAGIEFDNYYASEIDKYGIEITQKNNPETIQLGDVQKIVVDDLPKIDLLIGGSPCQSLSRMGDGTGFAGKSQLFYEYVRILNEIKKTNLNVYFFLENVKMKKDWAKTISDELGVEGFFINSNLYSGQNRERIYWTNIPYGEFVDQGIKLGDVLESNVDEKYYLTDHQMERLKFLKGKKSIERTKNAFTYFFKEGSINFPNKLENKAQCLVATGQPVARTSTYVMDNDRVRRITPVEAERLQTIPDNYTESLSDSIRYKLLGNGWTVDVIVEFFKNI